MPNRRSVLSRLVIPVAVGVLLLGSAAFLATAAARVLPPDSGDGEARAWYRENRVLFDTVARAEVTWARITDETSAKALLERAARKDQDEFERLVTEAADVLDSGTAVIDAHGDGADPMVARAAFAVGETGGVGLAPDPGAERWWLVRVVDISFENSTWDTEFADRVKLAFATHREQEHLGRLAESLRERWPVRVNENRLAEVSRTEATE